MDFRRTEEQRGFAASLSDLLRRSDAVAVARAWAAGDTEPGLKLWRRLAEQGVSALLVSEQAGGMGGSAADLVVAFEVLGHELAVGPWIESAAFLPCVLSGADLEAVASGRVATVAWPPVTPYAVDADAAEVIYAPTADGGLRECALPGDGDLRRSVDTTRRLFEVGAEPPGETAGPGGRALDLAALACAAELLGAGERLLEDTVAYVGQRRQYGREIGSFQAVKHALADVRIALDFARPLVDGAALAGDDERSRSVSAAKIAAADAAYLASRVALQCHGAIGYTAELDLGLWITRVRALAGAWGTPTQHRDRVAQAWKGS